MNKDDHAELKGEVIKNMGNVSMNFKYFEFKAAEQGEKKEQINFSFPKYRSFEADAATLFYKNLSRIVKL